MTDLPPIAGEAADHAYPPAVRRWLPGVVVAVAMLHALAVAGNWAIRSDSGLYMTLGRSLAEGRGLVFNGRPVEGIPPLLPVLIAGCRLLAGPHALWFLNAVVSLCAVGAALAGLGIVNRTCGRLDETVRIQLAVGSFLVTGTSARVFGAGTQVVPAVPLACLFLLGVYALVRSRDGPWAWCLLAAAAITGAVYTDLLALPLLVPVVLAVVLDRGSGGYGKRVVATLFAAALVVAAFGVWLYGPGSRPGQTGALPAPALAPAEALLPRASAEIGRQLARAPRVLALAVTDQDLPGADLVLAGLVVLGAAVAAYRRQWMLVLPAATCLVFASARPGGLAPRHLLPVLPMLACLLLVGTRWTAATALRWVRSGRLRRLLPRAAVTAAVVTCLAVSLPKDLRHVYWARHPDFITTYEHGKWEGVVGVSRALARRGRPATDTVATPEHTVVHYLTRLRVVTRPLWTHEGRALGMWDPERIPPPVFADAVTAGRFRFLVIPAAEEGWSEPVLKALARTSAFTRPQRFADMVLLRRLRSPARRGERALGRNDRARPTRARRAG